MANSKFSKVFRFLKEHSLIFILIATVVCLALYLYKIEKDIDKIDRRLAARKIKKYNKKEYSIPCLDFLRFKCSDKLYCSKRFLELLDKACQNLRALKLESKLYTYIKIAFDLSKANAKLGLKAFPFFNKRDSRDKELYGIIYLPPRFISKNATNELYGILLHEIGHAIFAGIEGTRIVQEFFAIYIESATKLKYKTKNLTCFGEYWNQPGIATHFGEFVFPPLPNQKVRNIMIFCRYGQLKYVIQKLHQAYPRFYQKFFNFVLRRKGQNVSLKRLLRLILMTSKDAHTLVKNYYILREHDGDAHIIRANYNEDGSISFFVAKNSKIIKNQVTKTGKVEIELKESYLRDNVMEILQYRNGNFVRKSVVLLGRNGLLRIRPEYYGPFDELVIYAILPKIKLSTYFRFDL